MTLLVIFLWWKLTFEKFTFRMEDLFVLFWKVNFPGKNGPKVNFFPKFFLRMVRALEILEMFAYFIPPEWSQVRVLLSAEEAQQACRGNLNFGIGTGFFFFLS